MIGGRLVDQVRGQSFLEDAFVRWVLTPAARPGIAAHITAQFPVTVPDHSYQVDFVLSGSSLRIVVELDGYAYHSDRGAFVHDRIRQNDLSGLGFVILRFSYDAIRDHTALCVRQLQEVLRRDPLLANYLVEDPLVPVPEDMAADPLGLLTPPPQRASADFGYFDRTRFRLDLSPLRACQREAMIALANYYRRGETNAACVMSVGAGKTALGVAAAMAFTRRRALIVTPGRVIRGAFATALDADSAGNVLYTLPGGPLLRGARGPKVAVLDAASGSIGSASRADLLGADIIVTNFHALNAIGAAQDLLAKLEPDDIDFIVVDEAHIAAARSYQRLFDRFPQARRLLMSACFTRGDGKAVRADVVYRYRLIDSIADGHAKHPQVHRFTPDVTETTYEINWLDGRREQIIGKDQLLEVMQDERKLARITATSEEPIHHVMRNVADCLARQTAALAPVRPRVLFAAIGQRHAEQVSRIANAYGIACDTLHHSMTEAAITATRARYEAESGNLQGIVQLRMLGQGYDLPAISIVVPMRPYGSFGEFYQFLGRGVRTVRYPEAASRSERQYLDVVYHGELGLDEHMETLRHENDMDPHPTDPDLFGDAPVPDSTRTYGAAEKTAHQAPFDAEVLAETGHTYQQILHDTAAVEAHRDERELDAYAQRYAAYAAATPNPRPFTQFVEIMRDLHG
ncbi:MULTISPECIES: DEAD/DEAH box helicase family protein [Micromonospora]|uniref:DEAD/DEAH box helicase family protein n=1 Tax=Micromonospora TaxID=1873 RepID=UPI00248C80CB|nr:DEAD/DEAH box helicase family protein [Micromonospora sp. WMMC264]WBB88165.1 DEAD/DEAH box helicase family protein [Micromonospora sp. WMMC264]